MKHDYQFISRHSQDIREAYEDLQDILKQVQNSLRKEFTFQHKLVGSCSRNMITCDIKSNIGYDFDVNIYPNNKKNNYSPKKIKQLFNNALNKIAPQYGYDNAEDSTRVLTIKVKDRKNSRILYSVDFAFVNGFENNEIYGQEYIHFDKKQNNYSWEKQPKEFYLLPQKIDWLKKNGLWEKMKKIYIDKKNRNDDPNKHSRSLFAEAVNETYQKYCKP